MWENNVSVFPKAQDDVLKRPQQAKDIHFTAMEE